MQLHLKLRRAPCLMEARSLEPPQALGLTGPRVRKLPRVQEQAAALQVLESRVQAQAAELQ